MDEFIITYEDEIMDKQLVDVVQSDEYIPLENYQPCEESQESQKEDVLASNDNKNACREILIDYTVEFTTYEVFKSKTAMTEWVREVGRRNGIVIVISSAQPAKRGRKATNVFICERGGKYRDHKKSGKQIEGNPKRMTGTKKCECPFKLRGRKIKDDVDEWTLSVVNGVHNHPAAKHFEGHSYAGRLNKDEKNVVIELSANLCRPRDILKTIKARSATNTSNMKNIYNVRQRIKVLEMARKSQMQYLMGKLEQHNYIEYHRCSGHNDEVIDMFWTHPDCIRLLRTFPTVLIIDCTYKTNKYCLPLLEIVGETSTGKTFVVAIAYLNSERKDNYDWVLGRLKAVMNDDIEPPNVVITDRELALMKAVQIAFPKAKQMLCVWHINKNVVSECKPHFPKGEGDTWSNFILTFNLLIKSPNEGEYNKNLQDFKTQFSCFQPAVDYVMESWLGPYSKWFVDAWTDKFMHLGNKTTNRAESQHAKLKRQLQSSQSNFATCFDNIHALILAMHNDIKESFERSMNVVQHVYRPSEFKELRGFISTHGLDLILDSCAHADHTSHANEASCECSKRLTHGLPCGHEVARYRKEGRPIPLSCIHQHWKKLSFDQHNPTMETLLDTEIHNFEMKFKHSDEIHRQTLVKKLRELTTPVTTALMEPQVKTNNKGRPKNSTVDTSTRRDPSKFEYVLSGEDNLSRPLPDPDNIFIVPPSRSRGRARGKGRNSKVHLTRSGNSDYIGQISPNLRPHILSVKDVIADGHCGFRAIAALLGFGEDNWLQVRTDLLKELRTFPTQYELVLKSKNRVVELETILDYSKPYAPYDYWFTMPDMGYIVASCYGCVLYFFGPSISLTFLPLRIQPVDPKRRTEIAVGFVNGNHFVQMFLKRGHPVPPVAAPWCDHRQDIAIGWDTPYLERISNFKALVTPECYNQDVTFIDCD